MGITQVGVVPSDGLYFHVVVCLRVPVGKVDVCCSKQLIIIIIPGNEISYGSKPNVDEWYFPVFFIIGLPQAGQDGRIDGCFTW